MFNFINSKEAAHGTFHNFDRDSKGRKFTMLRALGKGNSLVRGGDDYCRRFVPVEQAEEATEWLNEYLVDDTRDHWCKMDPMWAIF